MKQFVVKNFWLKVLALFLALIVWFYVASELGKGTPEEKELFERVLPYRVSAKEVPIKINMIGQPHEGYRILNDRITIRPSACLILGPKSLLKNLSYVTTEAIDIGEFTKSIIKEIKIKPIGAGIVLENDFMVNVAIPIEKIEQEQEVNPVRNINLK